MKIKMKHNKKRNTAFLYEALVRRVTKCVLEEQRQEKEELVSVIKSFFGKGKILSEELTLYQAVLDSEKHSHAFVERIVTESKSRYSSLSRERVFSEQSKLISVINKNYGKDFYNSHVSNYRALATLSSIFNNSTPVKTKVLLERSLINELASKEDAPAQHEMMGTGVLLNEVMKGFNSKYTTLFEEQKCLLNAFILSLSDDGTSLKAFLNEELGRLRGVVEHSLTLEEVKSDLGMKESTEKVLLMFDGFKTKAVDSAMLERILKIQTLAREVQS